jgi:anti-sigma factor RsiW
MSGLKPLSDDERDELVAYLDGELPEQTAHGVESRLNKDLRVRAEADALKQTWELLDYLPRPEPSPSFATRTVERISALRTAQAATATRWRWWVGGVGWAAALLLAGVAGYAAMTSLYPKAPKADDMVNDLRVIENLKALEAVDDIDFLMDLDHPDRFGEDSLGSY